jgi:hypothetical protein
MVDMEAFKAANPGCVLGDFIRWHSPKDWAEDKRQMSARMADAGNYWQELWTVSVSCHSFHDRSVDAFVR